MSLQHRYNIRMSTGKRGFPGAEPPATMSHGIGASKINRVLQTSFSFPLIQK